MHFLNTLSRITSSSLRKLCTTLSYSTTVSCAYSTICLNLKSIAPTSNSFRTPLTKLYGSIVCPGFARLCVDSLHALHNDWRTLTFPLHVHCAAYCIIAGLTVISQEINRCIGVERAVLSTAQIIPFYWHAICPAEILSFSRLELYMTEYVSSDIQLVEPQLLWNQTVALV